MRIVALAPHFLLLSTRVIGQTGPGDPAIVGSFFPADLLQQINDDPNPIGYGQFSCSAQYDGQTIIAGYSNGVASNISVLQQQGGAYTRTVSLTANINAGPCELQLVDVNGDGVPDVKISFVDNDGNAADWLFTWNGTVLTSIGPTVTVGIDTTSAAINSLLVDVQHDGTLQLLVPGDRTGESPHPDVLYHLVNGSYVPSPILIAFYTAIGSTLPQPISIDLPIVLPTSMHGPYVLTIANGNTQGSNRLQGTVTINNGSAVSVDTSTSIASSSITLEETNTIQISTNGAAGSQAVILIEEITPSTVSLSGSQTSITVPETIGVTGSVFYSVTGLPTGVTAQFSPPAVDGLGDAVLTFLAGPNAVTGSVPITILATNSETGQTQTTSLTLRISGISPTAGFALSASTTSLSVNIGGSNAVAFTQTAPPTFSGTISYSVVGLPAGASVTFGPPNQGGSGASSATFVASSTTPPGIYSIAIIGTDQQSGITQAIPFQLTVNQNSLPSGWNDQDIGAVGSGGSAWSDDGVFSIQGAGCGESSTCDQANFAYQTVQGNWSSVVRITGGPNSVGMMGLMVRDNLAPNSNEVVLEIVGGTTLVLGSRNGNTWSSTSSVTVTVPLWIRLSRLGNSFTAFYSSDGTSWNQVASAVSAEISNTVAYAGVFISSGNGGLLSGLFDSASSISWTLPTGWADSDIGGTGIAGSAISSSGLLGVQGSGCGISSECEQFHYVYNTIQADWSIVTQLTSTSWPNTNAVAGLIIRDGLDSTAEEVSLALVGGTTLSLSYRTNGVWTSNASVNGWSTPIWMRLTRSGNSVLGYFSSDGISWSQLGSAIALSLNQTVYAGMAVSSGDNTTLITSDFCNILLTPFILEAPSSVSISANNPTSIIITEKANSEFTDPVALTLVNPSDGLSGRFSPSSLTGPGTATLDLIASLTLQPGYYPITISGTDSNTGVTQYATFTLDVQTVSIPASAPVLTVPIGNTGSVTVGQTLPAGVTNGVTFGVDGLVNGITAVVTPQALSGSGNETLTVTVPDYAFPGGYPLILRATDNATGNLVLNTVVSLIVPPTLSDFPEAVNATEQALILGGPTAATVIVNFAPGSMLSSVRLQMYITRGPGIRMRRFRARPKITPHTHRTIQSCTPSRERAWLRLGNR